MYFIKTNLKFKLFKFTKADEPTIVSELFAMTEIHD